MVHEFCGKKPTEKKEENRSSSWGGKDGWWKKTWNEGRQMPERKKKRYSKGSGPRFRHVQKLETHGNQAGKRPLRKRGGVLKIGKKQSEGWEKDGKVRMAARKLRGV